MFELIMLAVAAITAAVTAGVKAAKNAKQRGIEQKLTSEAFEAEGLAIRNSGWDVIEKQYISSNNLRSGLSEQILAQKKYQTGQIATNKNFDRTMLYILLGTAAVVIAILILRSKK